MQNFAISAMGRSGTRFLAETMDRSSRWCVKHEPGVAGLVMEAEQVADRFERQCYGEVNSYLRHILLELPVAKFGVIVRNPADILLSAINWMPKHKIMKPKMDLIALGYVCLDATIEEDGVELIRFERMTTDVAYLQDVLERFDVWDVEVSPATIAKKVNKPASYAFKTYDEIPVSVRRYYERQTNWYKEKYYASS